MRVPEGQEVTRLYSRSKPAMRQMSAALPPNTLSALVLRWECLEAEQARPVPDPDLGRSFTVPD
jgi:hypothetical protein